MSTDHVVSVVGTSVLWAKPIAEVVTRRLQQESVLCFFTQICSCLVSCSCSAPLSGCRHERKRGARGRELNGIQSGELLTPKEHGIRDEILPAPFFFTAVSHSQQNNTGIQSRFLHQDMGQSTNRVCHESRPGCDQG